VSFEGCIQRLNVSQRSNKGCPNSKTPSNSPLKYVLRFPDYEGYNKWILQCTPIKIGFVLRERERERERVLKKIKSYHPQIVE